MGDELEKRGKLLANQAKKFTPSEYSDVRKHIHSSRDKKNTKGRPIVFLSVAHFMGVGLQAKYGIFTKAAGSMGYVVERDNLPYQTREEYKQSKKGDK